MSDIDILKVIKLASNKKFEIACASFDVIDHIFKIDVPKNLHGKKLAVQALHLLSDKVIQYGYDTPENIKKLEKEYKSFSSKGLRENPLEDPNAPHHRFKAKDIEEEDEFTKESSDEILKEDIQEDNNLDDEDEHLNDDDSEEDDDENLDEDEDDK